MTSARPSKGPVRVRLLLLLGFGGLLILLSFIGVSALSVVGQVQVQNERIRSDYLTRARLLEQLRSDIYLSGTYGRDFLFETDNERAEAYRGDFLRTRNRIEAAVVEYRKIVRPQESSVFAALTNEISEYFFALQPALSWNADQRKSLGRSFMRDEVLQRRTTMINIAQRISQINQGQLETGNTLISSLFEQFRTRLVLLLIVTLALGLILAAYSMQRIVKLEHQSEQRYREIEQARREAQELSAKLVDAQEEERRRIARELHDEIGQSLSALLVTIGNLSKTVNVDKGSPADEQLYSMRSIAEKSVSVVRNMSLLLRPSMLDDLGLVPALQWQARESSRMTGMRVSVAAEGLSESLPDEYKTCIYRIVQEALHNCQMHAQAQRVRIQLQQSPSDLSLSVQDDGRGFQVTNKGLGLLGIEERVKRLEGRLSISSTDGTGTLLFVELPNPPKAST